MASGFLFALLLCLSIGLSAASCCGQTSGPDVPKHSSHNSSNNNSREQKPAGPCPPGWTQFGSRCFSFNIQGKSWIDAENLCNSDGGNLASVHSEEEHVFLRTFINQVTGENKTSWIGGFDSVKEGVWMWSDGSTFNYKSWGVGEPTNGGGAEHCLEMNYKDKWNDVSCNGLLPFVCSKNL